MLERKAKTKTSLRCVAGLLQRLTERVHQLMPLEPETTNSQNVAVPCRARCRVCGA